MSELKGDILHRRPTGTMDSERKSIGGGGGTYVSGPNDPRLLPQRVRSRSYKTIHQVSCFQIFLDIVNTLGDSRRLRCSKTKDVLIVTSK